METGQYLSKILNPEEEILLKKQTCSLVPLFKQLKSEEEASKNWDIFYKRNNTKFYKDRHWTSKEFVELEKLNLENKILLEVGCGVGNFVYPLLEETSTTIFYMCDFSPRAIDFVKKHNKFDEERIKAFTCDITKESLTNSIKFETINIASLIFVLSAINPKYMLATIENIYKVLAEKGVVLFRDYAVNDHAMIRFGPRSKMSERLYLRQDNTQAYYFTIEELKEIFESAGFFTKSISYIYKKIINKKEALNVDRVFIQATFLKIS